MKPYQVWIVAFVWVFGIGGIISSRIDWAIRLKPGQVCEYYHVYSVTIFEKCQQEDL